MVAAFPKRIRKACGWFFAVMKLPEGLDAPERAEHLQCDCFYLLA
jgi:hypothetical protein